ncbi:MAG: Esterase [Verrucomicrobiales bacterium]|nr:Esterase [Verrucomicrobiales bacterium]
MKLINKKLGAVGVALASLATSTFASTDYGPALWNPAVGCNKFYTSGNGHKFCVIHDMEGYYLSSISYLNSCSSSASVYYLVNGVQDTGSDHAAGEITQSVREANYAWHVGCWNTWMFGTEHEGFVSNPAWFTQVMYQNSGALQNHLAAVGAIAKDRNHIIGHNQWQTQAWKNWMAGAFPSINTSCNSHTDPGQYWNWTLFMNILNPGGGAGNRIGMARTSNGGGYWIAASDGGVFSFGNATFYGSMGGQVLNSPVSGICARKQGDGYWLVAKDGGIFSFGAAPFQGSMGGQVLNKPIIGMACTQSGNGYWLVGSDGGIFNFGDAAFYGSLGGAGYTDIVAISPAWHTNGSNGYRIIRSNGTTYDYNCSHLGGGEAGSGVVSVATTGSDNGFWEVTSSGAIFSYGNAVYHSGIGGGVVVGLARGPSTTGGYWAVKTDGSIFSKGDAVYHGGANF